MPKGGGGLGWTRGREISTRWKSWLGESVSVAGGKSAVQASMGLIWTRATEMTIETVRRSSATIMAGVDEVARAVLVEILIERSRFYSTTVLFMLFESGELRSFVLSTLAHHRACPTLISRRSSRAFCSTLGACHPRLPVHRVSSHPLPLPSRSSSFFHVF
jgi:hypothetical protein